MARSLASWTTGGSGTRHRLPFVYRQLWNRRRDRHSAAGGRDRRAAGAAPSAQAGSGPEAGRFRSAHGSARAVRACQRSDEGQPATVVTAFHDARSACARCSPKRCRSPPSRPAVLRRRGTRQRTAPSKTVVQMPPWRVTVNAMATCPWPGCNRSVQPLEIRSFVGLSGGPIQRGICASGHRCYRTYTPRGPWILEYGPQAPPR
jgi:hypothetical protein